MKEPVSVLVMAVGSPLGQSIYKALRASALKLALFRADISDMAAGFHLDDHATNIILPLVRSEHYDDALTACLREHRIDIVFPVISPEHEFFARHASRLAAAGIRVVTPDPGLYALCNDKYRSMQVLRDKGVRVPATALCRPSPELDALLARGTFPLIVKPRVGASSQSVFVVRSAGQLHAVIEAFPDLEFVVQEYLPDPEEFTVGVYMSRDGRFRRTIVIRRELKFGLSYRGEVIEDDRISAYSIDVCAKLGLHFSTNVQLKMEDGEPCAFEINPRLSSTTSVRAHFGFNEPEMILREEFGELTGDACRPTTGRFMRYWQEIYLHDA